jgi:hypothetical protein
MGRLRLELLEDVENDSPELKMKICRQEQVIVKDRHPSERRPVFKGLKSEE